MKISRFTIVVASLAVLTLSIFAGGGARASEEKPGQAMTVSPLIIEKQTEAGQVISFDVKVVNDISTPQLFKNYINDFETSDKEDEQGVPKLEFDNSKEPGPHSIRKFILPVGDFVLQGKQSKTIKYTFTIPAGTTEGGYYGSIRFTSQPSDTSSQVDITASIGNLVFINVGGEKAKDDMVISDFFTSNTSYKPMWFFENGPIQFNEWLKNTGNTFLRPTGRVELYDIFGKKVEEFKVNEPKEGELPKYLLPDTQRKFNQRWEKTWLLGFYTAKLYMIYGNNSATTLDKTITFWVIPWKLILLVIAVTIFLIWILRKGSKRYKDNIIREANKQKK